MTKSGLFSRNSIAVTILWQEYGDIEVEVSIELAT